MAGSWSIVLVNACPLIVLLPYLAFNLKGFKVDIIPMICAGLMIGTAFTLYANGLVETTIIRATLLFYLSPIWSTILGMIWLTERLTKARIVSIIVAVFGLVLLLTDLNNSDSIRPNIGDLFAFFSGVFWAIGAVIINRWSNAPTLPLTSIVYVATTIISILFALFIHRDPFPNFEIIKNNLLIMHNLLEYANDVSPNCIINLSSIFFLFFNYLFNYITNIRLIKINFSVCK